MSVPAPQSLYRMVNLSPEALAKIVAIVDAEASEVYTGITTSLVHRSRQHAAKDWGRLVSLIIPEHLEPGISREQAEAVEETQIKARRPWCNRLHNKKHYQPGRALAARRAYVEAATGRKPRWWQGSDVVAIRILEIKAAWAALVSLVAPVGSGAFVGAAGTYGYMTTVVMAATAIQ